MRLIAIHIYRWKEDNPALLGQASELSFVGYLQRRFLREHINFHSRTVCGRARPGDKTAVHLENNAGICYVAVHPNTLAFTVVSSPEYPQRVVFTMIADLMNQFLNSGIQWQNIQQDTEVRFPPLQDAIRIYQNPAEADKLMKIESELDQVREIMHKNIEELLRRGETLDSLMAKSQDLSSVSYDFYKRAKKNNQCCQLY
jgi:synaptobrevin family protein YKT6